MPYEQPIVPGRKWLTAMARNRRRWAATFSFKPGEVTTVLLWCLTGIAGSGLLSATFLCFSIWGDLWGWLVLTVPGAISVSGNA